MPTQAPGVPSPGGARAVVSWLAIKMVYLATLALVVRTLPVEALTVFDGQWYVSVGEQGYQCPQTASSATSPSSRSIHS